MLHCTLYTDTLVTVTRSDSNANTTTVEDCTWRDVCGLIHDTASNPYAAIAQFSQRGKIALDAPGGILITITAKG